MKFHYTVEVEFDLTPQEIALLMLLGSEHYDSTCREATTPGGFIFGWQRMTDLGVKPLHAKFHRLDTCCKILESSGTPRGSELYMKLKKMLGAINAEHTRINAKETTHAG